MERYDESKNKIKIINALLMGLIRVWKGVGDGEPVKGFRFFLGGEGKGLSPVSYGCVVGPRTGRRRDERRAKRREGGRKEEEHSTRGERVKSARRERQTTGIASPDC